MLELKVYNPEDSFLKRIEWNYEELKSYIEPISADMQHLFIQMYMTNSRKLSEMS